MPILPKKYAKRYFKLEARFLQIYTKRLSSDNISSYKMKSHIKTFKIIKKELEDVIENSKKGGTHR